VKRRRVLWGWIGESDSERTDILKGWSSLQVSNNNAQPFLSVHFISGNPIV
jgi:hypothetical protein